LTSEHFFAKSCPTRDAASQVEVDPNSEEIMGSNVELDKIVLPKTSSINWA
jgi:hypothetical protein